MKRIAPLILIAFSVVTLCGCVTTDEEGDPNEITSLKIKGSLTKQHYALDEEWDYSGLKVYTKTRGGKETKISDNDYTISNPLSSPKEYCGSMKLKFFYKKDTKITGLYTATTLSIDTEDFDSTPEIESYYADMNWGSYTGESLRRELQRHSFAKHTNFITYGNLNSYKIRNFDSATGKYNESTDLIPNTSRNEAFYSGVPSTYNSGTREHVWACADSAGLWEHDRVGDHNVDDPNYIGGGSDLFHIRPVSSNLNTARGDAPFVDFDDSDFSSLRSSVISYGDSTGYKLRLYGARKNGDSYEFAQKVEVADEMKGDVARIIAYVYMHYATVSGFTPSGTKQKNMVGNLKITDAIGYSSSSKAFSKLVEWNNLDPVSEVERYRNHTVMAIQGNRNPFIDYPDLMGKVF